MALERQINIDEEQITTLVADDGVAILASASLDVASVEEIDAALEDLRREILHTAGISLKTKRARQAVRTDGGTVGATDGEVREAVEEISTDGGRPVETEMHVPAEDAVVWRRR